MGPLIVHKSYSAREKSLTGEQGKEAGDGGRAAPPSRRMGCEADDPGLRVGGDRRAQATGKEREEKGDDSGSTRVNEFDS